MGTTNVKKQGNKLERIMKMPVRALSKARDFYVKSMTGYAEKVSYSHSMASMPIGNGHLPRSFSASSKRLYKSDDSEDFRELVRAASVRSYGHKNEADMYMQQLGKKQQQKQQQKQVPKESLPKTKSVRAVGMGRIEEAEEEGSSRGNLTSRK